MRYSILCLIFSLSVSILSSRVLAYQSDCGLENIVVEYSAQSDAGIACEGVLRALSFFEHYGYSGFENIYVKMLDPEISESLVDFGGNEDVKMYCGLFIGRNGHSEIFSWETTYAQQRKVFGSITNTQEYLTSIVAHEVAHDIYNQIFKLIGKDVKRPLTEFVSYVVQIETMKDKEKAQVLKLWPDKSFKTTYEINTLTLALDPNMFGVMSYRYHCKNPDFIKLILEGKIPTVDDFLFHR
mgnify:CR=1 FL=1